MFKALLWDVDGTMAETERDGHRVAFNRAFESLNVPWRWDEADYGQLLHITGGRERLLFDMQGRADAPPEPERDLLARALHARKNDFYAELVLAGGIPLRAGVLALMQQCEAQGVRMAIATTTSRSNLDALLRVHLGPPWASRFAAVLCGEDVARKKPNPEVYLKTLAVLGSTAGEALALEDAPAGLAAARAVGIPVVVTRSLYFAQEPMAGALAVGPGLHDRHGWVPSWSDNDGQHPAVGLADLQARHTAWATPRAAGPAFGPT